MGMLIFYICLLVKVSYSSSGIAGRNGLKKKEKKDKGLQVSF